MNARQRAGWLRCRVLPPDGVTPAYTRSPRISGVQAMTIGGTAEIAHAETVRDEVLGTSDGAPGQRFTLQRQPVVPWTEASVLHVTEPGATEPTSWVPVRDFAHSGPGDRHYRLDPVAGEVQFGPEVRRADGELWNYGAVPLLGSRLEMSAYRVGGGRRGNVARGVVRVLKSSVPYVTQVENRHPAAGGVDGETMDNAKLRGPLELRASGRAVTADDFEVLARDVAPDAARVACLPATSNGAAAPGTAALPGAVRLLVVPRVVTDDLGRIAFDDLRTPPRAVRRISDHLDRRRLVGTRLVVELPYYQGVTAVARVTAGPDVRSETVQDAALRALYAYLSPQDGGSDGKGWQFGRAARRVRSSRPCSPAFRASPRSRRSACSPRTRRRRPRQRTRVAHRHPAGCARLLLPAPRAGAVVTAPPRTRISPTRSARRCRRSTSTTCSRRTCARASTRCSPRRSACSDCFPAYLDPRTAPPDMVDWLASWTGLLAARKLPVAGGAGSSRERRPCTRGGAPRTPCASSSSSPATGPSSWRESGAGWSPNPGTPLPGSDRPGLAAGAGTSGVLDRPDEAAAPTGPDEAEPADAPVGADPLAAPDLVVPAHLPVRVERRPDRALSPQHVRPGGAISSGTTRTSGSTPSSASTWACSRAANWAAAGLPARVCRSTRRRQPSSE